MPNTTEPVVSIAMPTYNRADSYLKEAIQCALNQTYQNFEIIVSDNCSSDETESVVKSFQDTRLRYFRQTENIGSKNNCNFCLAQARGKYFLLLFDDDRIDADFLDICLKAIPAQAEVGVVLTGTRTIDEKGNIRQEYQNQAKGSSAADFFLDWFVQKAPLYLCSTLYRTQGLREIGGFQSKTNCYLDVVATAKLMGKYQRVDVPAVKASFRQHTTNLGSSMNIKAWCDDSLYLLNVICEVSGEKKELVRSKGMRYFCRVNYNYIRSRNIRSQKERWSLYWCVYKTFGYVDSPFQYLFGHEVVSPKTAYRLLSYLKRKTRDAWSRAPVQ